MHFRIFRSDFPSVIIKKSALFDAGLQSKTCSRIPIITTYMYEQNITNLNTIQQ